MRTVGVRELRERMGQILREVSEKGESVQVTHRGRVLALLVPPPRVASPEELRQALEQAHRLMERIGERAVTPTDSSTLLREERRW